MEWNIFNSCRTRFSAELKEADDTVAMWASGCLQAGWRGRRFESEWLGHKWGKGGKILLQIMHTEVPLRDWNKNSTCSLVCDTRSVFSRPCERILLSTVDNVIKRFRESEEICKEWGLNNSGGLWFSGSRATLHELGSPSGNQSDRREFKQRWSPPSSLGLSLYKHWTRGNGKLSRGLTGQNLEFLDLTDATFPRISRIWQLLKVHAANQMAFSSARQYQAFRLQRWISHTENETMHPSG